MKACTRSVGETRSLAGAIATLLRPGDLVVLAGDLGAGKTAFAQGIAAALGVTEPVVSPSFTIVREYEARFPLVHVDVYRLDNLQELHDLGFEELVDGDRLTLVEWGDAVAAVLPPDRLVVRLEPGATEDERTVMVIPQGASWRGRLRAIEAVLADFDGHLDGEDPVEGV